MIVVTYSKQFCLNWRPVTGRLAQSRPCRQGRNGLLTTVRGPAGRPFEGAVRYGGVLSSSSFIAENLAGLDINTISTLSFQHSADTGLNFGAPYVVDMVGTWSTWLNSLDLKTRRRH